MSYRKKERTEEELEKIMFQELEEAIHEEEKEQHYVFKEAYRKVKKQDFYSAESIIITKLQSFIKRCTIYYII